MADPSTLSLSGQLQFTFQLIDGMATTFPATNADGTANQPAQADAIRGIVAALIANGLTLQVPGIDAAKIPDLVVALVPVIAAYKAATKRPTL